MPGRPRRTASSKMHPSKPSSKASKAGKRLRPSQIVKAARAAKRPLLPHAGALAHVPGGPYSLTGARGLTLADGAADDMLARVWGELGGMYAASEMAWNTDEKRGEMTHPHQQHVIVGDAEGRVAFLSYRFDVEGGAAVMYVYEVFVERRARRRGLAVAVMRMAERLAEDRGVKKMMLTTFVANVPAMRLYREKLGCVGVSAAASRSSLSALACC